MANYGGFNFTSFRGVNLKNTAAIRIEGDGGKVGTLAVRSSQSADRQWFLPDKNGTLPITGTFAVNLPAVTSWGETMVTVTGLRTEDALVCNVQNQCATVTTGRTFPILTGASAQNGYVYLTFYNPTGTATLYTDLVVAYTVAR